MSSLRISTAIAPIKLEKYICPPAYHPLLCAQKSEYLIKESELDAWYDWYEKQPFEPFKGVPLWFIAGTLLLIFSREITKKTKETYQYAKPRVIKLSKEAYALSLVYIEKIVKKLEGEKLGSTEGIHPFWLHKIVEHETEKQLSQNPKVTWHEIEKQIKINLGKNPDHYSFIKKTKNPIFSLFKKHVRKKKNHWKKLPDNPSIKWLLSELKNKVKTLDDYNEFRKSVGSGTKRFARIVWYLGYSTDKIWFSKAYNAFRALELGVDYLYRSPRRNLSKKGEDGYVFYEYLLPFEKLKKERKKKRPIHVYKKHLLVGQTNPKIEKIRNFLNEHGLSLVSLKIDYPNYKINISDSSFQLASQKPRGLMSGTSLPWPGINMQVYSKDSDEDIIKKIENVLKEKSLTGLKKSKGKI